MTMEFYEFPEQGSAVAAPNKLHLGVLVVGVRRPGLFNNQRFSRAAHSPVFATGRFPCDLLVVDYVLLIVVCTVW
jgi:hypothetical protein